MNEKDLKNATNHIKEIIKYSGICATGVFIVLTVEFFVLRNGVSYLIGSQTQLWWLGLTLGLSSIFATAYALVVLMTRYYIKVKKELSLEQD